MDLRRQERETGKVERIPFSGLRLKLQLSKSEQKAFESRGMVPHWFNDTDGRVEQALSAGYTFVKPEYARSLGHSAIHEGNTDVGAKVSKIVTKGKDLVMRAYLMEIKKEFYDEDYAAKQVINDKVDEALALGGKGGTDVELAYRP